MLVGGGCHQADVAISDGPAAAGEVGPLLAAPACNMSLEEKVG